MSNEFSPWRYTNVGDETGVVCNGKKIEKLLDEIDYDWQNAPTFSSAWKIIGFEKWERIELYREWCTVKVKEKLCSNAPRSIVN